MRDVKENHSIEVLTFPTNHVILRTSCSVLLFLVCPIAGAALKSKEG